MPRKNKSTAPAAPRPLTGPQRLNKVLAAAGLGSRRDCEQFILDGRIEVDGQPVTDLATKVDPDEVKITFDGTTLKSFRPVYFALHKPSGVLSTNSDPSGRMRAIDLVNVKERIFSVGRLDRFSEGLMLLTNDGELAQRLAHPRFGVQKLYLATVQGEVSQIDLEKLVRGVRLSEGFAKVDAVKLRRQRSGAAELEIALSEGKNREIRRILARLGHKVVGLRRLAIGPLRLGQLPVGGWRPLTREEVLALYSTTTHRRKRRGPMRVTKSGPRPAGDADEPMAIGTSVGHFHQSFEDDDDGDDYGPPPIFGDEADDSDDEIIALNDHSVIGTVIPYEYEEEPADDDTAGDDSEGERRPRKPRGDRPARAGRPQSARPARGDQRAGTRPGAARSNDRSGETTGAASSPWDLRNRTPKSAASRTGTGRPSGRSSAPRGAAARSDGPRSSAPRSAAAARTTSPRTSASRSGTPRPGAGRTEGPRPPKPRPAGPRSAGPRSGGPRAAGPRTAAPRSAADRTGAPHSASSRSAATPRSGGAARTAGPRTAGPRTAGPRTAGPRTGGPRTGGPRSTGGAGAGPRTSAPRSSGAGPRTSGSPSTGPRTGGARTSAPRSGGQRNGGVSSGGRSAAPKGKRGGGSASRGKRK